MARYGMTTPQPLRYAEPPVTCSVEKEGVCVVGVGGAGGGGGVEGKEGDEEKEASKRGPSFSSLTMS